MRKYLVAASALALSVGSALAADLPSKKGDAPAFLPPPPPPPMWTGFYVGVNAGYAWSDHNVVQQSYSDTGGAGFGNFPLAAPVGSDGFIGGGQIGYNAQIHNFVAGLETDIQGLATSSNSATFVGPGAATTVSRGLDYLGTVRGRVGYLVTPTFLLYATGGLAYGQTTLNATYYGPGVAPGDSFSDTRVGYSFGGGAEWMFMPNWSAKVEYLHYDLGHARTPGVSYGYTDAAGAQISSAQSRARFDGNIVRAGVNYHFNLFNPAPVAAKY